MKDVSLYDVYAAAALTGFLSKGIGSDVACSLARDVAEQMIAIRSMQAK